MVFFTDQSTLPDTWFWDFGDGNTSTLQNPTHTYQNPWVYDVSLQITLENSCTGTDVNTNFIQVIGPDVDFSTTDPTTGCQPLTANFNDNTTFGAPINLKLLEDQKYI